MRLRRVLRCVLPRAGEHQACVTSAPPPLSPLPRASQVDSFSSWAHLLARDPAIKLLPVLGATLLMYGTMKFGTHPLALPAVLLAIPAGFHVVLLATHTTLAVRRVRAGCWRDGRRARGTRVCVL